MSPSDLSGPPVCLAAVAPAFNEGGRLPASSDRVSVGSPPPDNETRQRGICARLPAPQVQRACLEQEQSPGSV